MSQTKTRITVTVDPDLVAAAEAAVAGGRAVSVSAFVNDALRAHLVRDARMVALGSFVAGYEAESRAITDDEIAGALRGTDRRAIKVRPRRSTRGVA
jgi:Arc/MetJ-type ribon-helix-helix transcriptional regulator